jgi:hypothetical protein
MKEEAMEHGTRQDAENMLNTRDIIAERVDELISIMHSTMMLNKRETIYELLACWQADDREADK